MTVGLGHVKSKETTSAIRSDQAVAIAAKPARGSEFTDLSSPSSVEDFLMNSSDATPDNSPPTSPPPSLLPPKAKRHPASRPRKSRPPNELVLKIKPPAVTKPRSSATALPRKRMLQTDRFSEGEPFDEDTDLERHFLENRLGSQPRIKKLRVEKPSVEEHFLLEGIDQERPYVEKPLAEKPRIKKPRPEKDFFVEDNDLGTHYVAKPPADKPRIKKPRVEKPFVGKPFVEKPFVEKPFVEKPRVQNVQKSRVEKFHAENLHVEEPRIEKSRIEKARPGKPRVEKPRVEKPRVEKPRVEKLRIEQPRIEQPRMEQPRIEKPPLDQPSKKPRVRVTKPVVFPRQPKQAKQKEVSVSQQYPGSDWDVEEAPSLYLDRNATIANAAKRLEDLLEVTTGVLDELQQESDEVERLEEEKARLLDELLVWEGLIEKPYGPPTYNPYRSFIPALPPTKKKVKRVRK